ncbi:MAG: SDR family oxidoreductase [Alphaproteobacteria bacterium]|nr:SDR family oxidoreductase [Alphaproteobacteria bacterium]
MTQLAGKRVLITGAARGLGRAFAEAAAAAGAAIVVADLREAEGEATAAALRARGHRAVFRFIDLADPEAIGFAMRGAVDWLGGLDGLINNAAIATGIGDEGFEDIDLETWDRVMAVNVRGTWLVTRAAAPALRASRGKVVNIASDTALWGAPQRLHYVASKGALIAMTRALARELDRDGVAVNAVAPGLTTMQATESMPAERRARVADGLATGPVISPVQSPDGVVDTVLYLLSEAADDVTGQLLGANRALVTP